MKAELLNKWLEALRSGKYQQGRGTLRDADNKFCCLGVLLDVAGEKWHQIDADTEDQEETLYPAELTLGDYYVVNPDKGKNIKNINNTIYKADVEALGLDTNRLIEMNDSELWRINPVDPDGRKLVEDTHSFADIADYIEENVRVESNA